MPAFPKPSFNHSFNPSTEIEALKTYRDTKPGRAIPRKRRNRLLLATWNIANLGLQERESRHYSILAEIISWFDIIALQEVNDDLSGLDGIMTHLPSTYKRIFTDKAGNNERMVYLFDSNKVQTKEKFGEIAVPPSEHRYIRLPNNHSNFKGFDRNPFLASFQAGGLDFILVNVHLFFGDESSSSIERRCLETYAVGRWADLRRKSKYRYSSNIIALGDFNLPKVTPSDPVYKALVKRGLELPKHTTKIYSNIANDKEYDQIAFLPGIKSKLTKKCSVFDFDSALLADLHDSHTNKQFKAYMRYYFSDHRPLWMELKI